MAKPNGEFLTGPITRSRMSRTEQKSPTPPGSSPKRKAMPSRNSTSNSDKKTPIDIEEPDKTAPDAIRQSSPILQWIIYCSKKILKIDPFLKAAFYLSLSVICSSVSFLAEPFKEFSAFQKNSFFNQWFVKLSWGWTFWLLLIFFSLCGYVESGGRVRKIARNVTRLLVGTAMWYGVTVLFIQGIERNTGKCSRTDILTKHECVSGGETWGQFDISGHAFLLVYCGLLILEEARGFFTWEKEDQSEDPPNDGKTTRTFEYDVKPQVVVAIRVLAVALAILTLIWDWMLLVTLTYYHSFVQRFLGVALGVVGWFITYHVWYPKCFPGLPGDMEGDHN